MIVDVPASTLTYAAAEHSPPLLRLPGDDARVDSPSGPSRADAREARRRLAKLTSPATLGIDYPPI
jgi:hypothetical protein